jgi:hypothetical protein
MITRLSLQRVLATGDEIIRLAYGADVLQRTIQHMTDFDPSYKIPDDFFPEKK